MHRPHILKLSITAMALASITLVVQAAPCRNVAFDTLPAFTPGGTIGAIAAADFDGDGYGDLVIGRVKSDSSPAIPLVKVFLGGEGQFQNAITVSETLYAGDVQVVDFDADRAADLLIAGADNSSTGLFIFANRGNSFSEVWRLAETGSRPVVGDFNGDGHFDIARRIGSELEVLVRRDGTFEKVVFPEPVGIDGAIISADLDKDGRDELIETVRKDQQLLIRPGSSATILGPAYLSPKFQEQPFYLIAGDFDGSGYVDLVTQPANRTILEVWHDPAVSSAPPVWQWYGGFQTHIAGDFTGDGVPDLLSHYYYGVLTTGVLGSNPTFQSLQPSWFTVANPNPLTSIAAADFDGNGTLDVAAADTTSVVVVPNRGDGHFLAPPRIGAVGVRALVDLNGDGTNDLIADTNPIVWFGNGDGTYRAGSARRPDSFAGDLVEVADLNRDGHLDMVVARVEGRLDILLGDGSGSFTRKDLGPLGYLNLHYRLRSMAIADLDRDGNLDIVFGSDSNGASAIIVYGRGDGTIDPLVEVQGSGDHAVVRVGDLNGDGLPDLIANGAFLNTGQRTFRSAGPLSCCVDPQLADMNGDGKLDVITAYETLKSVTLKVYPGRGDGTFDDAIVSKWPFVTVSNLEVADFNGDGRPDVVFTDNRTTDSTKTFAVLYGKGNGEVENPSVWPGVGRLRVIDVDLDGRPDIMIDDAVRRNICMDPVPRRRSVRR